MEVEEEELGFLVGVEGQGVGICGTDSCVQDDQGSRNKSAPEHLIGEEPADESRRGTGHRRSRITADREVKHNKLDLWRAKLPINSHIIPLHTHMRIQPQSLILGIIKSSPHIPGTREDRDGLEVETAI